MRRLILALCLGCALLVPARAGAASVEGTVTPTVWAPEVEVCLAGTERCAVPGVNGQYRLDSLPEGLVLIEFVPSFRSRLLTQYYLNEAQLSKATPILLVEGEERKGIDADLIEGGAISGTVTAAGGRPLAEVEACARSHEGAVVKVCGETDSSGEYEIHSLPTGSYAVGFWGGGSSAAFEPSFHPAVAVTAGLLTAGVDATLTEGGRIAGEVTAAAGGGPLGGITVCLFMSLASAAQSCVETGAEGRYVFQGLSVGSYQVGFSLDTAEIAGTGTTAKAGGYMPQFYEGAATRAQATTIFLPIAGTTEGVGAALVAPALPMPAMPSLPVSTPIIAAPPTVAVPKPKKFACRKGYRSKKTKGKVRCIRRVKRHARTKRGKHKSSRAQRRDGRANG